MTMMKTILAAVALSAGISNAAPEEAAAPVRSEVTRKLAAAGFQVEKTDRLWNGTRTLFRFKGRVAWVIAPDRPKPGNPWTWTMQWWTAFVPRTGVPDLIADGYHHVVLDMFSTRAEDAAMPTFAEYQAMLVKTLGLAPKARLLGLSWGGFFSVRYAAKYPRNVDRIYLDAPLLNFDGFDRRSPAQWNRTKPLAGWTTDPRMPVNMAGAIAKAGIPVLLLYGGKDKVVPPERNCELFLARFKAAGGRIRAVRRAAYGHHPHGADPGDSVVLDFLR